MPVIDIDGWLVTHSGHECILVLHHLFAHDIDLGSHHPEDVFGAPHAPLPASVPAAVLLFVVGILILVPLVLWLTFVIRVLSDEVPRPRDARREGLARDHQRHLPLARVLRLECSRW